MAVSVSDVKDLQNKSLTILNKTLRHYGFNQSTWFKNVRKVEDGYKVETYLEYSEPYNNSIKHLTELLAKAEDKPSVNPRGSYQDFIRDGKRISEKEAIQSEIERKTKLKSIEAYNSKLEQGLLKTKEKQYKFVDYGYYPFKRLVNFMDSLILEIDKLFRICTPSEINRQVISPELKHLKSEFIQLTRIGRSSDEDLCELEAKIHLYTILFDYLKSKK
jgi:hypothetical protein